MEFERALFRVYERVVEDLVQTQPILTPTSSNNDGDNEIESDRGHLNDRSASSLSNNGSDTIPFLWPIVMHRIYMNGCWCRTIHNLNSIRRENRSRIWNILQSRRSPESTFSRISTDDGDIEVENDHRIDVEMAALSQNLGLRRRNNSSSSRDDSDGANTNSSTNSDVEDNGDANVTPTTRMAQEISNRQRQRNEEQDAESGGISQKGLFVFMRVCMLFSLFHMVVLLCLHTTYVGPRNIAKYHHSNEDVIGAHTGAFKTCLEFALETRPAQERSKFYETFGEDEEDENKEDGDEKQSVHKVKEITNATGQIPLLGRNEILQIKIVYGDHCSDIFGQCSRVHNVVMPNFTANESSDSALTGNSLEASSSSRHQGAKKDGKTQINGVDKYSSSEYWKKPAYKFSTTHSLMYLDKKMVLWHNISIVNVTLSERCLSTGTDDGVYPSFVTKWAQFLSQIYGMDALLINQFMFSIKTSEGKYRNGFVQNFESKERWAYSSTQLDDTDKSVFTWWFNRVGVLGMSCISFFLVTSITALIVRLLASSGVMIIFPIVAGMRAYGLAGIDERILDFSYPWVGRARSAINQQNVHPFKHFVGAHIVKLFLVYTMYESCQVAWSSFLYNKSTPASLPLWIFGNTMVYEYFSMVFVRSSLR